MRRIVHREDSFFFTIFHCEDEEQGHFTIIKPHYGELLFTGLLVVVTLSVLGWALFK